MKPGHYTILQGETYLTGHLQPEHKYIQVTDETTSSVQKPLQQVLPGNITENGLATFQLSSTDLSVGHTGRCGCMGSSK